MQKLVNLIDDVAEAAGIDRETMVPFEEPFVTELLKTLEGQAPLSDEDLISVGTAVFEKVLVDEASATEETNNDNDNEQVEVIEPEEVVPDARTMFEIQTEIGEVLNGNPMTIAKLASNIQCTKEFTSDIVSELMDLGLITKDKKTLHWVAEETAEPEETVEELVEALEEAVEAVAESLDEVVAEANVALEGVSAEAPAETTNHAADHAIEVAFATAKLEVLKVLDQQRKVSESNPAYKAQAEQYTEVMESLRGLLDEIQTSEQYKLHDPLWQRVARIAEWQPEA